MHLFLSDIREFRDSEGLSLISEARQRKAERYIKPRDKSRCIVAGLLLRYLYGQSANFIEFGEYGKPYLAKAGSVSPHFSLSHSGNIVAVLAGDYPCGVDVEKKRHGKDLVGIARRAATPEEYKFLSNTNFSLEYFYMVWAAKESVLKATGKGLSIPAKSFSVLPLLDGRHSFFGAIWSMHWRHIDGYELCCAIDPNEDISGGIYGVWLGKSSLLG